MKVLYIAPEFPSPGETAAQVRANALLPLLSTRVDLRILAFPPHGRPTEPSSDPAVVSVQRRRVNFGVLLNGTFSHRPRAFARYDTPEARVALARLLSKFSPDVVHFDSIGTLALLDVVEALPQPPLVVAHTHDAVSELYLRLMKTGPLMKRVFAWGEHRKFLRLEQQELPRCNVVIVDSPEDAAFLRSQTEGARVECVPIGVDLKRFSPDGPRSELRHPAIVFSGSMASDQSTDAAEFLVNKVMPLLWRSYPEAHVYLVGSNPSSRIVSLAADRVHVTGFVQDLACHLRAADVYVCPLRLGSGMRTRVIEALACGASVVSTSFGVRGLSHAIDCDAPWVVEDTAERIATVVAGVLHGSVRRPGCRARAYAAQHYSWDAVATQVDEIYRSLVLREARS